MDDPYVYEWKCLLSEKVCAIVHIVYVQLSLVCYGNAWEASRANIVTGASRAENISSNYIAYNFPVASATDRRAPIR